MGRLALLALAVVALSGCAWVGDVPRSQAEEATEWLRERLAAVRAAGLRTPRLHELPAAPEEVRTDAQWEASYRDLVERREALMSDLAADDAPPAVPTDEFIDDVRRRTGVDDGR